MTPKLIYKPNLKVLHKCTTPVLDHFNQRSDTAQLQVISLRIKRLKHR